MRVHCVERNPFLQVGTTAELSHIRAKHQTGTAGIRNLHVYLFRAFVRRVNKAKLKEPTLVSASEVT